MLKLAKNLTKKMKIKKIIIFLWMVSVSLLMSCKKSKMKRFPTIIEINSSHLAPNTNASDLKLVFGSKEEFDANTIDKLYNESGYSYFGQSFESIEGDHWNNHGLGSAYHEGAITKEGDVFSIKIYWKHIHSFNEGEMKPWKDKMKLILLNENLGLNDPDYLYDNLTSPILMKKEGEIEVDLKPKKNYEWDLNDNTFKKTGEKPKKTKTYYDPTSTSSGTSNNSNPLNGKWSQVNACSNSAGERNYFNFISSSSGQIGQIDCNNACSGGGTFTKFDYSISGSNVTIIPKSVSDYCGVSPTLASSFTVPFTISGNILTLDGQDFEK